MFTEVYLEKRKFEKYDNSHFLIFLNEEIIDDYIPKGQEGQETPLPVTAFAYTGPCKDGGTLIASVDDSRDNLINGIIRSKYSQSEEDALKTHQIIKLTEDLSPEKVIEYQDEWNEFNRIKEMAKTTVDGWMN